MGINCNDYYQVCTTFNTTERPPDEVQSVGPVDNDHDINTDYSITICGVVIPIHKTVRKFTSTYSQSFAVPTAYSYIIGTGFTNCGGVTGSNSATGNITEDCLRVSSTIHYLDERYDVVLYKRITQTVTLNVSSSEASGYVSNLGNGAVSVLRIPEGDHGTETVEWILAIGGTETILKSSTRGINTFPESILVLPAPPEQATFSLADLNNGNFYDYSTLTGDLNELDGGQKDMFYPAWCRSLVEDPFWRHAADRRYEVTWLHHDVVPTDDYVPESVTVDPVPIGSFVRHPALGDAWQFMCDGEVFTSPNFNALIDAQLALAKDQNGNSLNLATHDTTLYYPISII